MSNTAAHLVDRVIPSVPVRQWVLSLPFDVRARAAFDARALTELVRGFADFIALHTLARVIVVPIPARPGKTSGPGGLRSRQ